MGHTIRFLVVCKWSSMTGQYVANQYKLIFSEYGWPETLISDNGPLLYCSSLHQGYAVLHITGSSHYQQSNGLAEKYVQIVKSLFYKAKEEGKDFYKCCKDFYKCLMLHYSTPLTRCYEITYADSPRQEC